MTITECPRDAMQGIQDWIPTEKKIDYLNQLLQVGFDYLDFGSFVSPKAIPQMADSAEVLAGLNLDGSQTKLLAIIGNLRGAETAIRYAEIAVLGYPLSVSETFQVRNVNKSIEASKAEVAEVQNLALKHGKELQVYLSMGFGNPYGDPYSPELVAEFTEALVKMDIRHIAPSDTVGNSTPATITPLFKTLTASYPQVRFSAHLHTRQEQAITKVEAAWAGGCRHFDAALLGFGGCPMAADDLTGNLPTEALVTWLNSKDHPTNLNKEAWDRALMAAQTHFAPYRH